MPNIQKNNTDSRASLRQDRYENEIEGVSMKTLETGLWWAKNRRNVFRIFIVFLIIISVISWGYTIFGFGSYLLIGMNNDEQMVKNLVQDKIISHDYLAQSAAKNLIYGTTGIIENDGKYDLYAQISNPNQKHWGAFSYCFTASAGEKSCGKSFILPGEQKYVLSLAQIFKNQPSGVNFLITNIVWQKIDNHKISDWDKYRNDHLNISVKNASFTPAASNDVSEKIGLNTLSFNASNNSAYSYWEAPFTIILSNGGRIVDINSYIIDNFNSYDSKEIQITFPGTIGSVSNISITPNINITDETIFKQPNE